MLLVVFALPRITSIALHKDISDGTNNRTEKLQLGLDYINNLHKLVINLLIPKQNLLIHKAFTTHRTITSPPHFNPHFGPEIILREAKIK